MSSISRHLSRRVPRHSTVVAYLALVAALGSGGAYAAGQIGAQDIKKDAVRSKHVKDGQLRTQDLAANAVTSDRVADGTLTGADIANGSVATGDVTDGSLTGTDVADNAITGADVLESSLGQVPNAATLAGRAAASFAASSVYKQESAVTAGTDLGDGTFSLSEACDPGDILLSGGPANVLGSSDVVESFPTPGSTNSWSARIHKNGLTDAFSVVILCLDQA